MELQKASSSSRFVPQPLHCILKHPAVWASLAHRPNRQDFLRLFNNFFYLIPFSPLAFSQANF
jgi:hypothetical protein